MNRLMKRPRARVLTGLTALLLLIAWPAFAQSPESPKLPLDDWKEPNWVTADTASVTTAGKPYDPTTHTLMTQGGKDCSKQLHMAMYRQDFLHFEESKAHFDNCAFKESLAYIDSLINEARDKIAHIQGTSGGVPAEMLDAMLTLGQALHAMQDFYAHTNYVELMQKQFPNIADESDIPIMQFWTDKGHKKLLDLAANGLISGRFQWSYPHLCSSGVPSHGDLAKDSANTPAGAQPSIFKRRLTGQTLSNYTIAFNLASRTTSEFLRWVGQASPQIEKFCGPTIKYIVQPDRRAAD